MLYNCCEQESVAAHSALHALHTLCSAQHLNYQVSLMLQSCPAITLLSPHCSAVWHVSEACAHMLPSWLGIQCCECTTHLYNHGSAMHDPTHTSAEYTRYALMQCDAVAHRLKQDTLLLGFTVSPLALISLLQAESCNTSNSTR
jgi:hypothetical protein